MDIDFHSNGSCAMTRLEATTDVRTRRSDVTKEADHLRDWGASQKAAMIVKFPFVN